MSSRLFLSVREELGLAYDVGSGITEYADTGSLGVYAGVDPDKLEPAVQAILAQLGRLRDADVPAEELAKAKALVKALRDYKKGVRSGGGQAAMADVAYPLSEEEIEALAHYLAHL